ncbi:MAG: hypothetical protein ACRDPG_01370, partial [Nocardioidaceae bacterium]
TRLFRQFMKTYPTQRGHRFPTINGTGANRWGTAYAMGLAHHPVWKLTGSIPPNLARLRRTGFHAPAWLGAVLTGTSDSPFCVVDRASGFTVFGTQAHVVAPRTIQVGSAGITYHHSNGLDHRNPRSNSRRNQTSRGRLSDAMVIRHDLFEYALKHGTDLGHVLHLYLCQTRSADGFRNPMVGDESGKNGFGAEGERIAIDPRVNLAKRGLSRSGLVIARTLQRHGCYFGDNSGSQSCLHAEQETGTHRVWHGRLHQRSLRGVTWDDFVVIKSRR